MTPNVGVFEHVTAGAGRAEFTGFGKLKNSPGTPPSDLR